MPHELVRHVETRHGLVHIIMDVPEDTFLEDWVKTPYQPLVGSVVFYQTKGAAARETLAWEAGHGVGYHEQFVSGDKNNGAYVCYLTIAAPKRVLSPSGPPRPFRAPTPRDYAYVPSPLPGPLDPLLDDPRTLPAAIGVRHRLKDGGGHWSPAIIDGAGHSVPPMVAAIEKQKDEDLDTIGQLVPAVR